MFGIPLRFYLPDLVISACVVVTVSFCSACFLAEMMGDGCSCLVANPFILFYFQLPDLIRRSIISLCQVRPRTFLDSFVEFIYHFTLLFSSSL